MAEVILLAEDDPQIHELIRIILENKGYTVHWAEEGEKAVREARRLQPDLILLDVMMPKMNGYEVLHVLKEDIECKDIPAIFLSAKSQTNDKVVGLRMGGHDYITKPFDIYELIARVEAALRMRGVHGPFRRTNRRAADLALADPLTGLYNYTFFVERLDEEILRAVRHHYPVACLLLAIDHWPELVSRYGGLQGEQLIQRLALLLKERNRAVDILGRTPQGHFILLLAQTNEGGAQAVGKRMQDAIERARLVSADPDYSVTVSIGTAAMDPENPVSRDSLLHSAAAALEAAQRHGEGHVVVEKPS